MEKWSVWTGSFETEHEINVFAHKVNTFDDGLPVSEFDPYMLKVMTEGRNGPNDAHPGSTAFDDTGGFFEIRDGLVYLTQKAKDCIRPFF